MIEQSSRFANGQDDVGRANALPHPQDDVEALDRRARRAYGFTQPATQPVPVDGTRHRLAPDDVADATRILRGRGGDQLQEMRVATDTELEQRLECAGAAQPIADAAAGGGRNGRQTVRRTRPLARRAARTLRPPTVFIRARNPCVRARLTFEGWYVRFIVETYAGELLGDGGQRVRQPTEKPYIRARYEAPVNAQPSRVMRPVLG